MVRIVNNPIYEPKGAAGEYCHWAINPYLGCNHGCYYCYGPSVLHRSHEEYMNVQQRPGLLQALKKQLSSGTFKNEMIHIGFVCDPYPADTDTTPTREIIKIIKDSGNHVQILTKGGERASRDYDLLGEGDTFGVTISCSEEMRLEVEPNAAPIYERILSLKFAKNHGIKTWISAEPVLEPKMIYDLIEAINYIDLYKIGKLNYHPSDINWKEFGQKCEALCKQHRRNYMIKEALKIEMGKTGK